MIVKINENIIFMSNKNQVLESMRESRCLEGPRIYMDQTSFFFVHVILRGSICGVKLVPPKALIHQGMIIHPGIPGPVWTNIIQHLVRHSDLNPRIFVTCYIIDF